MIPTRWEPEIIKYEAALNLCERQAVEIAELKVEIERLRVNAVRYEKIRKINPRQFTEMWRYNLDGSNSEWKAFDELVDALKQREEGK